MKRKLLIAAIISFFIAGPAAYGLCSSETTNLNLAKPAKGDRNWGQTVNNNSDLIDAAYGNYKSTADDLPQAYVYSDTFNSTTGRTITLPNEVDAVTEYSVSITSTTRAGAIGDIYVTKTTTNFVVKCSEANTTDTFAAVVYYTGDASQYGGSIYRRWYVSPDSSITDHGNASTTGSLAWVAAQISTSPAVIEAPGNKNYQLKQNLTLAANISYQPQPGAIIDTDFSIRDSNYEWYQNAATSEYYLQAAGGGNPNINMPSVVIENNAQMTDGTAGSLAAGEWDWNDVNGLGYTTVYVRLSDSTDPDGKSADYVEAGYTLTVNQQPQIGVFQAFSGEGVVSGLKYVRPEWWYSGTGIWRMAFEAALQSNVVCDLVPGKEYETASNGDGNGPQISGKHHITIRGSGILKFANGVTNGQILWFDDCDDITIRGVEFDGNIAGGSVGNRQALEFMNVDPDYNSSGDCNRIMVDNCYIHDTQTGAVESDAAGIRFLGVNYGTIKNCVIENTDCGIITRECEKLTISGNKIPSGGTSEAISLWGASGEVINSDVAIIGNVSGKHCIAANVDTCTITGNIFKNFSIGGGHASDVLLQAKNVTFSGNTLTHRLEFGKQNGALTDITAFNIHIVGNMWELTDNYGIVGTYKGSIIDVVDNKIYLKNNIANSIIAIGGTEFLDVNIINNNLYMGAYTVGDYFITTYNTAFPLQVLDNYCDGTPTVGGISTAATDTSEVYIVGNILKNSKIYCPNAPRICRNNVTSTNIYGLASAAALDPWEAHMADERFARITGTTNITSMVVRRPGFEIMLKFDGILTFTDGGNLKIAGDFVTSADDTITLKCDGTNYYEVSRSAN